MIMARQWNLLLVYRQLIKFLAPVRAATKLITKYKATKRLVALAIG